MELTPTPPAARWRMVVVDDEEPGRVNLRYAVADFPQWELVGEFATVVAARDFLLCQDVDLVLLDIHMPRDSGMDLARELCRWPHPPLIVFVTAFDTHAIAAFEVHALDYVLKPIDDARLAHALARAEAMLAQRQRAAQSLAVGRYLAQQDAATEPLYWRHVSLRSVGSIECIALEHVLWIAAAGNYVELHLRERTVLYRIPITRLESHLDPREFVRTHRGFMVRVAQCVALSVRGDGAYLLALQCGQAIPVSEPYLARVRTCLQRQ